MTQYFLFCSKIPNTSAYVQESIKSDVRPQYSVLGGTAVENYLSTQVGEDGNIFSKSISGKNVSKFTSAISVVSNFNFKVSINLPGSNICRDIMEKSTWGTKRFKTI